MTNKHEMLRELLPTVGKILTDCFVSKDQQELWENFCNDVLATGEQEISYKQNTLANFEQVEQTRGKRIKSVRDAELLNVRQMATLTGGNIGLKKLIQLCKSGEIPAIEVGEGRMLLVLKEDFIAWFKNRKVRAVQGLLSSCPVGYQKKSSDRLRA